MARITDAINQGLERLSTSPLGMASLGLLMQPSMSKEPINPWAYAAKGLEMGMQNRQLAAQQKSEAELQGMRRNEYARRIMQFNQEQQALREAEAEKARQAQAMQEFMSTLPPEEARMAAVLGPEYAKQMLQQRVQRPTTLEQNLGLAGLIKGTPEFQQAMMTILNRPPMQIGTTDKLLTASDLKSLRGPTGEPLPYGTTQQEAARMGASPILPPASLTPEQQMENKAQEAQRQLQAKQEYARQQAAREVARLQEFLRGKGPSAAFSPKDRASYATIADAAANALAKARGTPGAEPPRESIDRARASLPSLEELMYPESFGNISGSKIQLLLEELGVGAKSMPTTPTPNQGAPVRNESDFQKRLRKYVPSAR